LSLLPYNLGNLWRRLVLPKRIDAWSLTSMQQRIVKTRWRLIKHARYYVQVRAVGTPLIALGPDLVANSLFRGQESYRMREKVSQIGNSA
jgi:hypothetical protein